MPLNQNPVMEPERPVHPCSDPFVVRGDQGRSPFAADKLQQFVKHDIRRCLIEIAGRLIGKDQGGAVGQRSRDGNALLLPARKLAWPMVEAT